MNKHLAIAALAAAVIATPLAAHGHKHHRNHMSAAKVEVVERDHHGRPSKIRHEGQVVDVCGEGRSDHCVNPREAGLGWGNQAGTNYHGGHDKR